MKNTPSFVFAVALGLVSVTAIGCGGTVEQPQTQANAASKAPVAPQTHGVVRVFGEALGEVPLRPEQRTELEKIAATADTRHASMGDGKKELALALADQIEKGTIDRAALQPKIDRIVADVEKARPEDNAALARMHAILDADQRNQFVDALEVKLEHRGRGRGHHKGEHGAKGAKAERGEGEHPKGGFGGPRGLKQLAEDLKLTDDQKTKVFEAMKSGHEGGHAFGKMHHDRMGAGKKVLESFRTDTFDATAAQPAPEKLKERVAERSGRFASMAEKILPILTLEQRRIAAEKVRTMANSGRELPFAH